MRDQCYPKLDPRNTEHNSQNDLRESYSATTPPSGQLTPFNEYVALLITESQQSQHPPRNKEGM
ncbi:hypothetical protein SCLCIDRAFT_1213470 [Scleroderma citrinum Foug A]|uniref:Uncharacterized protein n=1 Tax=Scleroderma citrinum Foug A TaxID=1036808 RepID=A0A0C3DUS4_9AGAM|nr:hypothetical protein SCLCIDRAFT_1213470 [Scleroderma citrinum Foug A]